MTILPARPMPRHDRQPNLGQTPSLQTVDLTLTVSGPTEVDVSKSVKLSGRLTPPVSGAAVVIESSGSGDAFAPTTVSVAQNADGSYTAVVPVQSGAGSLTLRAAVAATSTSAAMVSPPVKVYFADYKAAGVQYLSCVRGGNAALDKNDAAVKASNRGALSFNGLKLTDSALAIADRAEAACLREHSWPPSVLANVMDLAVRQDIDADFETQAGKATSITKYNDIVGDSSYDSADRKGGDDAAAIRARLGLPARS